MFTEEKKNSQISQDSDNVYKPLDEIETSNFIKEIYKKNLPTEIVGTNTKNFIGNKLQCAKILDSFKVIWNCGIFSRGALH